MQILGAFAIVTSFALAPARNPCEGWMTKAFWKAVDAATVRECIALGYSVDARSLPGDQTRLHRAAAFSDDPGVIGVLVEAGANLEAVCRLARTPLHHAARYNGNVEVVRALLRYDPDVYAENKYGRTPLHLAALFNENPEVVEELARVTHVDVRSAAGLTPLHDAARRLHDGAGRKWYSEIGRPNPSVAGVLLRHGADVATETDAGTPMAWADDSNVVEMIRVEEVRREAIRERFVQYVATRVALGTVVLCLLGYSLAWLWRARRGLSGAEA